MNPRVKTIIMIAFLLISAVFILGGIVTILNYQFQFSPDKLSAELQTTLIFGIGFFVIGIDSFLLFWGLYRLKKWFLVLYWSSFCLFCLLLAFTLWPWSSTHLAMDALFLTVAVVLPVLLGIYLRKHRSTFM